METDAIATTLPIPLTRWEDGAIRVTGSRVTPDVIVHQSKVGATTEQIQNCFPSLALREIYGVIFFYLEQTAAVEEYLRRQEQAGEETHRSIESRPEAGALRGKIRARRRQLVKA